MRKQLFHLVFFSVVILIFTSNSANSTESKYLNNQHFMSLSEAENRWGQKDFSPEEFKKEKANNRAKMAVSLIKKSSLLEKPLLKLKSP